MGCDPWVDKLKCSIKLLFTVKITFHVYSALNVFIMDHCALCPGAVVPAPLAPCPPSWICHPGFQLLKCGFPWWGCGHKLLAHQSLLLLLNHPRLITVVYIQRPVRHKRWSPLSWEPVWLLSLKCVCESVPNRERGHLHVPSSLLHKSIVTKDCLYHAD